MSVALEVVPFNRAFAAPADHAVSVHWLGQAGFFVRAPSARLLIDPYLSDSLAAKYRGTARPHERMMPPPTDTGGIGTLDLVLCTHHHTDHMDPATLAPLMRDRPALRLVAPRARAAEAATRAAVAPDRILAIDAGETIHPCPGVAIRAVRAAHETIERDDGGRHVFLGYAIGLDGVTIFHSGDTIPFPGQDEEVAALGADLALLPVNGRSAALAASGVPGNMTIAEAVALAAAAAIPAVVAHHYGMFAFNTVARELIEAAAVAPACPVRLLPATLGMTYRLVA